MKLELVSYLKFHKNYKNDWIDFTDSLNQSLGDSEIRNELIPFFGTKYFEKFSESERKSLFYTYIQFNAEVITFLERLLLISFRSLRADVKKMYGVEGVEKFMGEELFHSLAFIKFLDAQENMDYRNKKVVKLPKIIMTWLLSSLKFAPLGVCYPAVKLEAYSIAYWDYIKKYYDKNSNDWVRLNEFHAVDEMKHVPIHFEFMRLLFNRTKKTARFRTIYSTLVLFICLQLTLIYSSLNMLKISIPRLSRCQRLFYMLKMFKWIIRELPVYTQTRKITRDCFKMNKPPMMYLFSFMYL